MTTVERPPVADTGSRARFRTVGSLERQATAIGPQVWGRRYSARLAATDLIVLLWAGIGVHLTQMHELGRQTIVDSGFPLVAVTGLLVVVWFLALTAGGTRKPLVVGHGPAEYKAVARVTIGTFGAIAILSYLTDLQLPRSYLLVMMPAGLLALLLSRYVWRRWLQVRRDFGHFQSAVLAIGSRSTVSALVRDLQRSPRAGYRVVAVCLTGNVDPNTEETLDGLPIVGGIDDVKAAVRRTGADTVAVTASASIDPTVVRRLSWDLEGTQAGLVLAPALTDIAGPRIHTQPVNGLPLIHVDRPTYRGANRLIKKTFDFVGAGLMLLVLALPMLVVAVAIKISSPGPVLFLQSRVGLGGRMFKMVKFRTMVIDAEAQLEALKRERRAADAGNSVLFKMKDDPRVTRIGKILRQLSLDELPQLFNVLAGSMSLVGPRPPLADEVAQYGSDARRRLLVRPGLTGLWQVSGRSDLSWDESVRLDSYYVENWSITADLVIMWKTVRVMATGGGAY